MGKFNESGFKKPFKPRSNDGFKKPFNREMHKAICAECGQECEVPFKPQEDRPVYCRECYSKKRKF